MEKDDSYYQGDFVMRVIERFQLGFCLGNVVKYVLRAGVKTPDKLSDLRKAKWYLEREIKNLEALADEEQANGHWEAVKDEDNTPSGEEFWRVRWSIPNDKNEYYYVAHYVGNGSSMNCVMANSTARRWNKEGKVPEVLIKQGKHLTREIGGEK